MNLTELQNKIHNQNKSVGWWDEVRPFVAFACLFRSELSEAMEGDRKNLMDDKLPDYEMFWVEVADYVIRCMDWLGYLDYQSYHLVSFHDFETRLHFLDEMFNQVSTASEIVRDDKRCGSQALDVIAKSVFSCFDYADNCNIDLEEIITKKVAYNLTRADHKRENRAAKNGKKY